MKDFVRKLVDRFWFIRLLVFMVIRPKSFLSEFVYSFRDYKQFKQSVMNYLQFLAKEKLPKNNTKQPGLMIVAGVMSADWCQLWVVMAAAYKHKGMKTYALSSKGQPIQNLYFRLFNIDIVYIEDLNIESEVLADDLTQAINALEDFQQIKYFEHASAPVGKMALSTYSRVLATGIMDINNPESIAQVRWWMFYLCKSMQAAAKVYQRYDISMLFFGELFMDYYGGFYYEALNNEYNIIRFNGTVRDDSIVVNHQSRTNDRTHFSSISDDSWSNIIAQPFNQKVKDELAQNFDDRYSDRWALSKRNQANTKIIEADIAKKELGIKPGRKVVVIYSHILYDTLFFNGEYLFKNYAEWLVESIKAACKNPNVDWYVKIHPSNLWRGELEYYLDGIYEEERLINEFVGELPGNVKLIYPNTPYSPYTWLQIADYGVTVTGTSGIELGALGKAVVTAGTGRYEKNGFTHNSNTQQEYLHLLENIQDYPMPTPEQVELGKRFAYTTFCLKPFTMGFLKPKPKTGKSEIYGTSDLVYLGDFGDEAMTNYPASLTRFVDWSFDVDVTDFLNPWPES